MNKLTVIIPTAGLGSRMGHYTKNLNKARIVITELENSNGYGRIIINNKKFEKIKEQNDCINEELYINKVNCGIYSFNVEILLKWISFIKNNNIGT